MCGTVIFDSYGVYPHATNAIDVAGKANVDKGEWKNHVNLSLTLQ